MDDLKTTQLCGSAITSRVVDAAHRTDSKIIENIELVGAKTKPPQKSCIDLCVEYGVVSKFLVETSLGAL